MKLAKQDVEKRVRIKLDRSIKHKDVPGMRGIMSFGEDNDYPQIIERVVYGSTTAKAAADMYARFITGLGFENAAINDIVVGKDSRYKDITVLDLLRQCAMSVALHNGAYLHANVNRSGKVGSLRPVLFKNCRFIEPDDYGYSSQILVYDNWERDRDKKWDKEKIKAYDIFNLTPEFIKKRFPESASKYKGQIYFQFWDNTYLYPLSPFDSSYLDADTEREIALFKNREIRNGMALRVIMRVAEMASDEDFEKLKQQLNNSTGGDGDRALLMTDEVDEETGEIKENGSFKIDTIPDSINDKLFENWEKSLANNIRKSNKALPSVLIDYDESKLGTTSGEGIKMATDFYNAMTSDDRALMSRMFKDVLSKFDNETLHNNTDWDIKPISLINNEL